MKTDRRRSTPLLAAMRAPALRWPCRIVSVGMAALQFLTCQVWLIGTVAVTAGPVPAATAAPAIPDTSIVPPAASVQAADPAILLAQNTTVNRNVPADLPVALPAFSGTPTEAEITVKGGLQEPLVPVGNVKPTAAENQALAAALLAYRTTRGEHPEDVSALTGFLASYPASPWRAALLTNLGLIYRQTGYFSRALGTWEEAWTLASSAKQDAATAALADRTLSELAEFNSRLGRQDQLKTLLSQAEQRQTKGSVATRIEGAKTGMWLMQNQADVSFKCGPYALRRILNSQGGLNPAKAQIIREVQSTAQGTSVTQVAQLSRTLGMNYQMAKRQPGSAVIVPAVVHWKAGHFAAIVRQLDNGKYWVEDSTFGNGIQVTQAALDEEGSGYYLVSSTQALPTGWRSVDEQEGATVWGKGNVNGGDPGSTDPCDQQTGGGCTGCGEGPGVGAPNIAMPGYTVHTMLVSVHITDTPVGYAPPLGPSVYNTVTYNQYEANQLSGFNYSNFGPLWNFRWLSYIVFDAAGNNPTVHTPGGGSLTFSQSTYNSSTHSYGVNVKGQSSLVKISATNYVQHFPDGSQAVYSVPDASGNVFLKQMIDPRNNAVTLHYDIEANSAAPNPLRLASISDALGQVTTFGYTLTADPYKITQITDPFNRSASFGYSLVGGIYQLASITDVIGMTSQLIYQGSTVQTLTTPYGTTTFTSSTSNGVRTLEVTDPYGAKERWEQWLANTPINNSEPVAPSSTYMNVENYYLTYRNTLYWDKKAMVDDPSHPYAKATIFHWLHTPNDMASGTLESVKKPLENRVWYNYPGQNSGPLVEGSSNRPTAIGRVLDNGTTTQCFLRQYSADNTQLVSTTDPVGRTTYYDYDTNGIDLLMKRQATGSSTSVVLEKRVYDPSYPPHCPKQIINAAGQTTTYLYDSQGRVLQVTNPKGEITTYSYTRVNSADGPADGYLYSVTGAVAGATTSYTYDTAGRRITSTDSEGYKLTFDYDALNRRIRTTYPDAPIFANCTYTQTIYNRLDPEWSRDRQGHWTHKFYDALRRLVAVQDPLGRTTNYGYCLCGALTSLTDAAGNVTQYAQDLQGRRISETYPDNTKTLYTYETTTSRLKGVTDALSQTTNYTYSVDNKLTQISYSGVVNATPSVSFSYDPIFNRPQTMADSTGTISYSYGDYQVFQSYNASPASATTGSGMLTGETKAGSTGQVSYTLSYGYDELGRPNSRSVDGSNNPSSTIYDTLGRVTSVSNILGRFNYDYTTGTSQDVALIYLGNPGNRTGLRTAYSYYPDSGDRRLQTINNLTPSGTTVSRFDYAYNAVGDVVGWTQQADSQTPQNFALSYDAANQLSGAVLTSGQTATQNYSYSYDQAANRTSEQIDFGPNTASSLNSATFNSRNQVDSLGGGGALRVSGTLNKLANVTINNSPAQVTGTNFMGSASVVPGANTISIGATDVSGHTATNVYQVQVNSGAGQTPTYDANGNLTGDNAGNIYQWDAANRLIAINYNGTNNRTEFAYDGIGRRVQITEKSSGAVVAANQFVWCASDPQPCEQRDASNSVTKRFYAQGEQIGGTKYYFTVDHLGSVREMTDNTGAVGVRYSYDLSGRRSKTSGSVDADFGFTGYYFHSPSNLQLAEYREYDANTGRWLSRDPLPQAEMSQGPNLYAYVQNNPSTLTDPFGLAPVPPRGTWLDRLCNSDCDTLLADAAKFRAAIQRAEQAIAAGRSVQANQNFINEMQTRLQEVNDKCGGGDPVTDPVTVPGPVTNPGPSTGPGILPIIGIGIGIIVIGGLIIAAPATGGASLLPIAAL